MVVLYCFKKYSWLLTNTYVIGRTRSTSTTNQNQPILKFMKQVKKWMDAILSVGRPYFGGNSGHTCALSTFCQLLYDEKLHSINSGATNINHQGPCYNNFIYVNTNFRECPSLSQLWMTFNTLRLCFSWKIKCEGWRNV